MTRFAKSIEQTAIDALIPYARNSRTHSEAQVAQIAASKGERLQDGGEQSQPGVK
jgi:hypothetical protein